MKHTAAANKDLETASVETTRALTRGDRRRRKAIYMNLAVKKLLGSAYSWDGELGELNYGGNPLSGHWQTEYERLILSQIERNWHEAITS